MDYNSDKSGHTGLIRDQVPRILQRRPGDAADIVDRRNESRKWMQLNYWDQWEEAYRNSKCLTQAIMVRDARGREVEDKSRTNVCMPETSLSIRRKTARLTANPPQMNYTGGDELVAQKLTAWAYQQFDKSGESKQHQRLIQTGVTFGWAASKLWWDVLVLPKRWQRSFYSRDGQTIQYRDRAGVMRALGAPQDEIDDMVEELGPNLDDEEVTEASATLGLTFMEQQDLKQFEGPIVRTPFIGDLFIEPGCETLDLSGWVTEDYPETDRWLEKMSGLTYFDEEGEEVQVFDPKAVADLESMGSWNPNQGTQQPYDLRTRFRTSVLGQQVPLFPTKLLRGKRYDILENHQVGEDGRMWIEWVGNEAIHLGAMPYPWELYGKYVYTEFTPLPDLLQAHGDSIPVLHRFLQALHNSTVGQRKDLVNQILRPCFLRKPGFDVDDEVLERKLMRFITVRDFESIKPLIENPIIGEALSASTQEEAQILRMWGLADPSLTNVESGTEINPQAGKTATTAVLSAKSADALTQYELNEVSRYLKDTGQKKVWMLQQVERENNDPYHLEDKYVKKVEALSRRFTGQESRVTLYPDELAQDFEVEPEAMSMLSVDDDLRRQAGIQMVQAAAAAPNQWDPYYVNRFYAGTIRGVDPDKAVPPPKPPPPPPPPEPRVSFSISGKFEDLEPEVQLQILQKQGFTISPETAESLITKGKVRDLTHLSAGADAAENLTAVPNGKYSGPETNLSRGVS